MLPLGKSYACKLLAQDPTPHKDALARRLAAVPQGAYLAVDLLKVEHQGERIEGVGRCYDSNSKGVMWGHTLVSNGLVQLGENPYLLRRDPFIDELMSTKPPKDLIWPPKIIPSARGFVGRRHACYSRYHLGS